MTCPQVPLVHRHFALEGTPADERALRAHLPTCAECTRVYGRKLWVAGWLPWVPTPQERLGEGLGFGPSKRRASAWLRGVPAVLAVGLMVLVFQRSSSEGFQPRAAPTQGTSTGRLFVHQRVNGTWAEQHTTLVASEPIAFSYVGETKRPYLMVWAGSESDVWWFYPAWVDPAANPTSIQVNEAGRFELPDAVTQPLRVGRVRIWALFSERPHSVQEIEALLARVPRPVPLVSDGVERTLDLEVSR